MKPDGPKVTAFKEMTPQQRREFRHRVRAYRDDARRHAEDIERILRGLDAIGDGPSTIPPSCLNPSGTDLGLSSRDIQEGTNQAPAQPAPTAWDQFIAAFYREVQAFAQTINQYASEGADFMNNLPPGQQDWVTNPPETRRDEVPSEYSE